MLIVVISVVTGLVKLVKLLSIVTLVSLSFKGAPYDDATIEKKKKKHSIS